MMRLRFPALAALLFSIFLTGCFFEHPLTDHPSKDINTWLLGVWESQDENGNISRAGVMPLTGDRMTVWYRVQAKTPDKTKEWEFEAWISRVGEGSFLSLKCKNSPDAAQEGKFVFLHYQVIDQNNVITRGLQLDAAPGTSSFDLRKEVRRKRKDRSLLPAAGSRWTRISEVYWNLKSDKEQPFQPLRIPGDKLPGVPETLPGPEPDANPPAANL